MYHSVSAMKRQGEVRLRYAPFSIPFTHRSSTSPLLFSTLYRTVGYAFLPHDTPLLTPL